MKDEFKIKFRGVRGSHPVPGENTIRYGGNTTCVEVRVNGHLVILDAGTGIISLGQEMMCAHMKLDEKTRLQKPMTATLLFTHTHLDHVQGLPFFTPIYIGPTRLYMFGPTYYNQDFKDSLASCMHSPIFPVEFDNVPSYREVKNLIGSEVIVLKNGADTPEVYDVFRLEEKLPEDAVKIYTHQSYAHPCNGVIVYKIEYKSKVFVFATDIEGYKEVDTRLCKFSQGADLLVHDAQYTNDEYKMAQGFGHSTIDMATEVAKASKAKKLALFHHDPRHSDKNLDEILGYAREKFSNTIMAREMDEIDLLEDPSLTIPDEELTAGTLPELAQN